MGSDPRTGTGVRPRQLAVAVLVSAAVVLSAPFLGQLRAYLRAAFPGHFVTIVGASLALAMAGAFALALARIQHARGVRYAVIGASVLFYLAFRPLGDAAMFILPVLAAFIVGTLDEWLQWFIPNRVGEARDVFLNLVAIACGLAFGAALEPPRHPNAAAALGTPPPIFTFRLFMPSRRIVTTVGVSALLVFAAFANAVHLGYFLIDPDLGAFKSHYHPEELRQLAADRAERWRTDPPIVLKRLSREDQYLDEGLWHIRERNSRWEREDYDVAYLAKPNRTRL